MSANQPRPQEFGRDDDFERAAKAYADEYGYEEYVDRLICSIFLANLTEQQTDSLLEVLFDQEPIDIIGDILRDYFRRREITDTDRALLIYYIQPIPRRPTPEPEPDWNEL